MAPPETQAFYTGNIILQYLGTSNLIFSFIHETFGMATQDPESIWRFVDFLLNVNKDLCCGMML